jgi:hypothetical protein
MQTVVWLSALTPPPPPEKFLVLIYVSGWVKPGAIVGLERLDKLTKSTDIIKTQTHDLPSCSIALQAALLYILFPPA